MAEKKSETRAKILCQESSKTVGTYCNYNINIVCRNNYRNLNLFKDCGYTFLLTVLLFSDITINIHLKNI